MATKGACVQSASVPGTTGTTSIWPMSMTGLRAGSGTAKRHQQRMVDKLDLAHRRTRAARPAAYVGAQVVRTAASSPPPASMLEMVGKRQHAAQALARASFVQIGKIVLMRKEAPNLGHDILSTVMTRAAHRSGPAT